MYQYSPPSESWYSCSSSFAPPGASVKDVNQLLTTLWVRYLARPFESPSAGGEYWYNNQFGFRAGYFYENKYKGNRSAFNMGVSVKYNIFTVHFSYLFPSMRFISDFSYRFNSRPNRPVRCRSNRFHAAPYCPYKSHRITINRHRSIHY